MAGVLYPVAILGAMGAAFGALLAFASIKFFVDADGRVSRIREALPGANCGGCGYPGCDGYAEGVVSGGARTNLCAAGGPALAAGIAEIMGVEGEALIPTRAFLMCKGSPEFSKSNAVYDGIMDCRSAAVVPSGSPNTCPFGCIGLGTCVKVCVFGAMSIVGGLASADPVKCIGCGTCVAICPKSALRLIPRTSNVQVVCNSNWRGPDVKKACSVGCIGCGICAKACPAGAITVEKNLASVDASKCVNCGACVAKCPTKSIGYIVPVQEEIRETA
ncbi:MAG: RnfABCDGE type electron transport complex subunit B [Synergistaceae bacterium]|nr:RnfABCDGE type electron transport complex subunit B [Synergistaceae bacterium]